jgi:hypothetical protein
MAAKTGMPGVWDDITWNPPIHRGASGAYLDAVNNGKVDRVSGKPYRSQMMGPDGYATRMLRKGVIFQHIANDKEWEYDQFSNESGAYKKGNGRDGNRYGFRFHYNPSTLRYGMGVSNDGINPAIIMSGAGQSMPITPGDNPATVGFTLYLNRIEDMALIDGQRAARVDPYQEALRNWQRQLENAYTTNNSSLVVTVMNQKPKKSQYRNVQPTIPSGKVIQYFYGQGMTEQHLNGIYERGTGYDLEFLFRTLLGKPWKTLLRGSTADVGIAFGVPMILDFNSGANPGAVQHGQRYLGRVSSISYNHLSFNRRMVPMWTEVNIDFLRYPDVVGALPGSDMVSLAPSTWNADSAAEAQAEGLRTPNLGGGVPGQTPTALYFGGTPLNPAGYAGVMGGEAFYSGGTPTVQFINGRYVGTTAHSSDRTFTSEGYLDWTQAYAVE